MNNSKTFCPLPWIHLATRPNGDVRLCCTANASGAGMHDDKLAGLIKNNNKILNLETSTIEEIWNSNTLKTTRLMMLQNLKPSSCSKCYNEESLGIKSKRQWESEVWKERLDINSIVEQTSADGSLPMNIPYFDLRLGNACQLKCIMCSPHDSSSWIKDWNLQQSKYTMPELIKDQQWNKSYNYLWYKDAKFLDVIETQAHQIKEVYFAGGEPLIIPEHYKILKMLIASNASKTCTLRYNSNGLSITDNLFELWSHFKKVIYNFSIDAYGDKNDYIRYPSEWNSVVQNLHILDTTSDNVTVNIACAVQLLNVMYLTELARWKIEKKFKKINLSPYGAGIIGTHLVYLPSYLNIRVLPVELKEIAASRINKFCEEMKDNTEFMTNLYGHQRWQGIIKYMLKEDWSSKLQSTVEYLETCDKIRNTNFREIFKDLSSL